jgi:adenosylcobinamide kinase/adenosylcobinamide-phosphate guanylyltransferase
MGNAEATVCPASLRLILGGARSGKSSFAEELATALGGPVVYVATAQALDDEMRARVAAHRARRPKEWFTLEAPTGVAAALLASKEAARARVILLDCMTLLVSNIILADAPDGSPPAAERAWSMVRTEVEALVGVQQQLDAHLLVVSNEVGLGVVPPYDLGRVYRDCLGWTNQTLARAAGEVVLMVAGLPVDLKALPLARHDFGGEGQC